MMNKLKKGLSLLLCALLVVTAVPFSSHAAAVKLNKKTATVYAGKTLQLKVKNTKKSVKWSTSNKKIATVSKKGLVTAKKDGKATITAKIGKNKYTCKVTVKSRMNITKKTLTVKGTCQLKQYGLSNVKWKSSNTKVATVTSKGKVTAKKTGTATITAYSGKKKVTCKITVKAATVTPLPSIPVTPTPTPQEPTLTITAPTGTVYPYADEVKAYLQAGAGAPVTSYWKNMDTQAREVNITWENTYKDVTEFVVSYATKEDYSDAITTTVAADKTSLAVCNLYKNTTYYVKVTAKTASEDYVAESTFKTTDLGPRFMLVDGIANVRDLGGYQTADGKTTLQGLIFRGGSLTPTTYYKKDILSEAGKKYMSEVMGIKTEIELRGTDEYAESTSQIPGATFKRCEINGYDTGMTSNAAGFKAIFQTMADPDNYPIYFHCTGGADRTGTLAFLLNALLDVDETSLVQDYELTSFSRYGIRDSQTGTYTDYYKKFRTKLDSYDGSTLAEKAENYLLSIGVTATEIYNIRAIMRGEETSISASAPSSFDAANEVALAVTIVGKKEIKSVTLDGQEVSYTETNAGITIKTTDFPSSLENKDTVNGVITFTNNQTAEFTFTYNYVPTYNLTDYIFTPSGKITADESRTSVKSDLAIGYGKAVRMELKTTTVGANGDSYYYIGSYGVHLRGGTFRMCTLTSTGTYAELSKRVEYGSSTTVFDSDGGTLILATEVLSDTQMLLTATASNAGGSSYTLTHTFTRIDSEIASDDAKVTIITNPKEVSSIEIKTGVGQSLSKDVSLTDYWTTQTGTFTLDATTKKASSDLAIGYGKSVRIQIKTATAKASGDTYYYIGSYGIRLRGGLFRMSTLTSSGTYAELYPRVQYDCPNNIFDGDGKTLILETEIVSDSEMKLHVTVEGTTYDYSYTFARIADEITTDNARVTLITNPDEVSTITVQTGKSN